MKNLYSLLLIFCAFTINAQNQAWLIKPIPLNAVNSMYFWSADSGYAFGGNNECKILITTNGGNSWNILTSVDKTIYGNLNSCVQFWDKNIITLAKSLPDGRMYFKRTNNAGISWNETFSLDTLFSSCKQIHWYNDTILLREAMRVQPQNSIFQFYEILISTDGGKHFSKSNFITDKTNIDNTADRKNLFFTYRHSKGIGHEEEANVYRFRSSNTFDDRTNEITVEKYSRMFYINKDTGFSIGDDILPEPYTSIYDSTRVDRDSMSYQYLLFNYLCYHGLIDAHILNYEKGIILKNRGLDNIDFIFALNGIELNSIPNPCKYHLLNVTYGDEMTGYIGTDSSFFLKTNHGIDLQGLSNTGEVINNALLIYPNPASNYITLIFPNIDSENKVIVTDMVGHNLLELNFDSKSNKIDISGFPNGVYTVKYKNQSSKLVIHH